MLQVNAFVYHRLMDFPKGRFDYETLTTVIFFESIHRLISVQIYLYHSQGTDRIYSYVHDFCNMKIKENQSQFSCRVHNFFGFGIFFLIKGSRLSVWETKNINISGSGIASITFVNIGSKVKFIDTMKYF